jgi:hypothetical protein
LSSQAHAEHALQPPFRRLANPEHWRSQRFFWLRVLQAPRSEAREIRRAPDKPAESWLQPGLAAPQRAKVQRPAKAGLWLNACPTKGLKAELSTKTAQKAKSWGRPERPPAGTIACHTKSKHGGLCARRAIERELPRVMFHLAATTALAARPVVTAALRRRESRGDGDRRERGNAQNDFRNLFHLQFSCIDLTSIIETQIGQCSPCQIRRTRFRRYKPSASGIYDDAVAICS